MSQQPPDSRPWYADGLRFQCQGCGSCCCGEPGAVWVTGEEIAALAARLEIESSAFERLYVRRRGIRRALFERFNGDCVLFDPQYRRCRAYAARPWQCRSWPFWRANLASPEAWRATCEACPGCGQGEIHPFDRIVELLSA